MKKLLLIDPLGRAQGMERWHENFTNLAEKIFDLKIFSNYKSTLVSKKFTYDKRGKVSSIISILYFNAFFSKEKVDNVAIAHYGESFNTLLFLPSLLKYPRSKRYLLIHDAVSTLKSERKSLRNKFSRAADKLLLASVDNLIVHNESIANLFPDKKTHFLPLPPTTFSSTFEMEKPTNQFLFWGFIKKSKNVEFIIELAKLMPQKVFHIYGTFHVDEYRRSFLETLAKNNIENLHFFETFINEEQVSHLLTQYDAVLMPYKFITNSGILQTNADYCAISITSDLPAFKLCSDISVNIELDVLKWKNYLESLDKQKIFLSKQRIAEANTKRVETFLNNLEAINS